MRRPECGHARAGGALRRRHHAHERRDGDGPHALVRDLRASLIVPDEERVTVTVDDGVADVRLVRADKRNALDRRMFQAIIEAGERIAADRTVRAVVLSGDGKAFCAGLDTSLFAAMAERDADAGDGDRGDATSGTSVAIRV